MKSSAAIKSIILDMICLSYAFLFVYAAVSKLLDFENFRVQLRQSPLLSAFAGSIAWMVPMIEFLIALFIVLKRWRLISLFASYNKSCTCG